MIAQIQEVSPLKAHDVLGMNNVKASHWIGDRLFYQVKHEQYVKGNEASPIDYKEYFLRIFQFIQYQR